MGSIDTAPEAVTLASLVAEFEGVLEGLEPIYCFEDGRKLYDVRGRLYPDEPKSNISLTIARNDSQILTGLTLAVPRSGEIEIQIPGGDPRQLTINVTAVDSANNTYIEEMAPDCLEDTFHAKTLEGQLEEILRFIQSFTNDTAYLARHAEVLGKARGIVRQAIKHQSIVSGATSSNWTIITPGENTFAASANFKGEPGNDDAAYVSENRVCVVDGVSTATDESGFAVEKPADIPLHTLIAGAVAQGMSLDEIKELIATIPDLRSIQAAIVDAVRIDDTNEWIIHHAGDTRWFVIDCEGAVIQRSTMDHKLGNKLGSMSHEEKKTHVMGIIGEGKIEGQVNFNDEGQLDTICRYTLRVNSRSINNAFPHKRKVLKKSDITVPEGGLLYLCSDGVDDFIAPEHVGQMWITHGNVGEIGEEICSTVSEAHNKTRRIMVGTGSDGNPVYLKLPPTQGDHATFALAAQSKLQYTAGMKARIRRIDPTLPLPQYETDGSVGFDILARETVEIPSGTIELIPGNIVVEVPKGYMLVVASRSSTPRKKGLTPPHGFGVIDQDYCGPQDEIMIQAYNFSGEKVRIERGEKIAQGVFVRVDTFEWEEVEAIRDESRGGFGSTDQN